MTNQVSTTKAKFDAWMSEHSVKPCFYYTATNSDYYVQVHFYPSLLTESCATISIHTVDKIGAPTNDFVLPITELSREQITLILSFTNPQDFIDYALSLKDKQSTPCPVPAIPSDDGDRASYNDDLPPVYQTKPTLTPKHIASLFILVNSELDNKDDFFERSHLLEIKEALIALDKINNCSLCFMPKTIFKDNICESCYYELSEEYVPDIHPDDEKEAKELKYLAKLEREQGIF